MTARPDRVGRLLAKLREYCTGAYTSPGEVYAIGSIRGYLAVAESDAELRQCVADVLTALDQFRSEQREVTR